MEKHMIRQNATASFPPLFHRSSSATENTGSSNQAAGNRIITDLNLRYNLQLPRVLKRSASGSGKQEEVLARSCSEFIELMASQQHRVHIPDVIQDFEEWAKPVLMKWVPKRKQERETLLSQSILSFNHHNAIATAASFTPEQRLLLLKELKRRLYEEWKLIGDSEVYSRSSELAKDPSTKTKVPSSQPKDPQPSTPRIDRTLKRKKPSSTPDDLLVKCQSTSTSQPASRPPFPERFERVASTGSVSPETSFSTTASSNVPAVFTQSNVTEATSNVTSTVDDDDTQSTNYFPSQEALEILDDESIRRSLDGTAPNVPSFSGPLDATALVKSLEASGPFQWQDPCIWRRIPLRNRYELQRIADSLSISPKQLLHQVDGKESDLQTLWQNARSLALDLKRMLPEKSSLEAFDSANDTFHHKSGSSVTLSGSLSWANSPDRRVFRLQLQPLKLERSCRFYRRFGADRFLVLRLPSLSAQNIPRNFASPSEMHSAVSSWLAGSTQYFLGREWRAFYVEEEEKGRSKKSTQKGFKVHLFAVNGFDFGGNRIFPNSHQRSEKRTALEIHELLNWHLRISDNLHSTDCKLFQRIALGLSRTHPTVVFEPCEFIHLPDPCEKPVMNDGCARISMSAAKNISDRLGLLNVPSVFQGRIAGAKGVWMVVKDQDFPKLSDRGYAIEVSDSQLKVHPHPRNLESDNEQRTFEVCEWSRSPRTASLTKQFLSVLEGRGVPKPVFEKALLDENRSFFKSLKDAIEDPLLLRTWLQTSQRYARSPAGIKYLGAWPDDSREQAIQFLESGFLPDDCSILLELLRKFLKEYFDRYIEKLAITLPESTYVYCIADPYGILAENEIHLGFSENWKDGRSGFTDTIVDSVDVLVARSPALLPSDIQRRRASWKRELRHFKDVIVFSTKGDAPLASLLSGGDYDGDRVVVIWDQSFVSHFQNANVPNDIPSPEECHIVNVSRKLSTVVHEVNQATAVDEILSSCFQFNLRPSLLGSCTTAHEKLVYNTGTLSSKNAILLATIAGYLVDGPKQGLLLEDEAWKQVRAESGCGKLKDPAYKLDNASNAKSTNVIDYLKFQVALPEKEAQLTQFAVLWPQRHKIDHQLMEWWKGANSVAQKEKDTGDGRLQEILDNLNSRLDHVVKEWQNNSGHMSREGEYARLIQNLFDQVRSIKPYRRDHPMIQSYEWEKEHTRWSFIRAACLYEKKYHPSKPFVWHMVGQDLCRMKLTATEGIGKGPSRTVSSEMYQSLQVNTKLVRRLKNLEMEELEIENLEVEDVGKQLDDDFGDD